MKTHVGPFSPKESLQAAVGNRRTKLARINAHIISELTDQIGDPTPAQRILIEIISVQYLKIYLYTQQYLTQTETVNDEKIISWFNSCRRGLRDLGLERRAKNLEVNLHDIVNEMADEGEQ